MRRLAVAVAVAAAALAGCAPMSIQSSATHSARPVGRSRAAASAAAGAGPVAVANRTHEYPSPVLPPDEHGIPAPSAEAAVLSFAEGYINWNASTVVADLRRLAGASVGQARAAMRVEAAEIAGDYELRGGGISNSGTVEAVAPIRASADQYAVVTQESTSAANTNAYAGLRPAWHVTVATVRQVGRSAWVLSGWQPES